MLLLVRYWRSSRRECKGYRRYFKRQTGAKRDIIVINAGAALLVGGKADNLVSGIRIAAETIDNGKALGKLKDFVKTAGDSGKLERFL